MIREEIFTTNSSEETQKLGKDFSTRLILIQGSTLVGALVIALYGDLGSGKTTFVQGLAQGLGIKTRIMSPTFVLIRQYQLYSSSKQTSSRSNVIPAKAGIQIPDQVGNDKISSRQARTIYFYHIDLYRIENNRDLKGLGIEEIIEDPQNIVAIEWAEKMGRLLPENRWDVKFEYLDDKKRKIKIKNLITQNSKLQLKSQIF